jgi:hypothetical protein
LTTIRQSIQADLKSQKKICDKKYIAELKSLNNPPSDVATVMNAVLIALCKKPDWVTAKKEMADVGFMTKLMNYDS